jgi:UDP-glucose 4-epimerase
VPSIEKPAKYFKSNVEGTLNVLEAARKYKIKKLLYAASSSCYGIPKKYPTKENEKIDARYPYALTKNIGEQLVMHWNKVYKLNVISMRFFNVYGIRSRTSGTYGAVFGVFLAQKLANKNLTIVGNGKQTRDFVYVKDVVRAMILAMKSKSTGEIFNVGAGSPVSVNEIVKNLNVKKKPLYIPKRPGESDITHANINKIKKILKWKPEIGIKEGIKLLIKNIDYWKKAPVWTPKKIKKSTREWFKYLG